MSLYDMVKSGVLAAALAGTGACAASGVVPRYCESNRCVIICGKRESNSVKIYVRGGLISTPLGQFTLKPEGCAVEYASLDYNKEGGQWYFMIDDECDGLVDSYASNASQLEQRTEGNEDRFKEYDGMFKKLRNEILEE